MSDKKNFRVGLAGHADKLELIKTVVSGRNNSHSFLFYGPSGNGKSACADIFAMSLNCLAPEGGLACGVCESCAQYLRGAFPYVVRLRYKFGEIPIDDIRTRIIEPCSYMVPTGIRQVFIIDDVRFFNQASANCFLKTLEEPIPGVTFILITSSFDSLLPTLKSRCQCVRFREVSTEETVRFLSDIEPELSSDIASFVAEASGSVGASLSAVRSENFAENYRSLRVLLNKFTLQPDCSTLRQLVIMAYPRPVPGELVPVEKSLHLDDLFDRIESKISSGRYLKNCLALALLTFAKRSSRRDAQALFYTVSSEIEACFDDFGKASEEYIHSFKESVNTRVLSDLTEHARREVARLRREEYMRLVSSLLLGLEMFFIEKNAVAENRIHSSIESDSGRCAETCDGNESSAGGSKTGQSGSMISYGASLYDSGDLARLAEEFRVGYYRDITANVNPELYLENFMLRIISPKEVN